MIRRLILWAVAVALAGLVPTARGVSQALSADAGTLSFATPGSARSHRDSLRSRPAHHPLGRSARARGQRALSRRRPRARLQRAHGRGPVVGDTAARLGLRNVRTRQLQRSRASRGMQRRDGAERHPARPGCVRRAAAARLASAHRRAPCGADGLLARRHPHAERDDRAGEGDLRARGPARVPGAFLPFY